MKIFFLSFGRKRATIFFSVICLILLTLISIIFTTVGLRLQTQSPLRRLTILIDPGHGGVDGGTADDEGNLEKEINLRVALALREQLKQSGLRVLMTRESDTDLSPFISGKTGRHRRDLLARVEKAKKSKSLFLVSIHCDWSEARQKQGLFVFYNYLSPASKELALSIQEEVNKVQKNSKKAAPGKYFIIRQRGITGVLVEVGFLSNREDAVLLKKKEYQETIALAIGKGILKYCRKYVSLQ